MGLRPDHTYLCVSLLPHVRRIKALIDQHGSRSVLDYGFGKGQQYDAGGLDIPGVGIVSSILEYWDLDVVTCCDPGVPQYDRLADETADGVICPDVLEHCPEQDIPWIVGDLFSHAAHFVFASIACHPAKTRLPNGENADCTIRPVDWWRQSFAAAASAHPGVTWKLYLDAPQA